MNRQRLRGLFRTTVTACIPWTVLGLITGVVFHFDLIPGVHVALARPIPGGLITVCMLAGAVAGVVNGLTFSGLVLTAERGKRIEELRSWRFASWGALATAGTFGLFFESPLAAVVGGAVGAVAGSAALALARRVRVSAAHSP